MNRFSDYPSTRPNPGRKRINALWTFEHALLAIGGICGASIPIILLYEKSVKNGRHSVYLINQYVL